jgi:hypothetical protein
MSWWATLGCACCEAALRMPEKIEEGGTYCVGGTDACCLNITYNYSANFLNVGLGGLYEALDGKTGAETLPALQAALAALGPETDPDYWKATDGNARKALVQLAAFAEAHPAGVWRIN